MIDQETAYQFTIELYRMGRLGEEMPLIPGIDAAAVLRAYEIGAKEHRKFDE